MNKRDLRRLLTISCGLKIMNYQDPLELSKSLIRCPSVTPKDSGAIGVLQTYLERIGFHCQQVTFSDKDTPDVVNLYARLGTSQPNFCFAGHTDVVPTGDLQRWASNPFLPEVRNGFLYGRGAADMKCAIAAFASAVKHFCEEKNHKFPGSISLLITGDEEGPAINGTIKLLNWLKEKKEVFDHCMVGEPTSDSTIGDIIKIGRRGSLNATITMFGKQGHVAYPQNADNPIGSLINFLKVINEKVWDRGTEYFQPTNLEVTSIDTNNKISNVIPEKASARINIRFNNLQSGKLLEEALKNELLKFQNKSHIDVKVSGEAFLNEPSRFSNLIAESVKSVSGIQPVLSTSGGTSDARFIKDSCPVVELGMRNLTAHQIDEHISIADLNQLTKIYLEVLRNYFASPDANNF